MAARLLERHDPLRDATSFLCGKAGIWHRGREPFVVRTRKLGVEPVAGSSSQSRGPDWAIELPFRPALWLMTFVGA